MGTKYLARSAAVLSEADRQQGIIDFMLFTHEQNSRMYGPNEKVKWEPGNPLYPHPRHRGCESHDGIGTWDWTGSWGNHVRPMIEEFIDGEIPDVARCGDCQTTWGRSRRHVKCDCGSEDCSGYWEAYGHDPGECFLCGEEVELRYETQGFKYAQRYGKDWLYETELKNRRWVGLASITLTIDGVEISSDALTFTVPPPDNPLAYRPLGLNSEMFVEYSEGDVRFAQVMGGRIWPYKHTPTLLSPAFVRKFCEITVIEPWYAPVWEYSDQRPHWPLFTLTAKIYNAICKAVRNPHQREVHESLVPVFEPREFSDEDCLWFRRQRSVVNQAMTARGRRRDARRSR